MEPVVVSTTCDRSVLGSLVEFSKAVPFYLPFGWGSTTLHVVEAQLAETPCRSAGPFRDVVFPDRKAPELLLAKWAAEDAK